MPLFLIERTVPGANLLSREELQAVARKSMCAIEHLSGDYRWHRTYIVGNSFMCVHEAEDKEAVREQSRRGGFPITRITPIDGVFGPETAGHAESPVLSG